MKWWEGDRVAIDRRVAAPNPTPNQAGDTPLLVAAQNMQTKAALALIEAKADVNVRNRLLSATPLMIAAGVGEVTLVKVRQVKV